MSKSKKDRRPRLSVGATIEVISGEYRGMTGIVRQVTGSSIDIRKVLVDLDSVPGSTELPQHQIKVTKESALRKTAAFQPVEHRPGRLEPRSSGIGEDLTPLPRLRHRLPEKDERTGPKHGRDFNPSTFRM